MPVSRRLHLWPRRLRWRLVLGFVLTVALLQAVLTGAERALLQNALLSSIKLNLELTVQAGLRQTISQGQKGRYVAAAPPVLDKALRGWLQNNGGGALLKRDPALLKRKLVSLLTTLDATANLPALMLALTQPDQPVALVDTRGRVLAQQSVLVQDKARARALGPAVLKSVLAAAAAHGVPWAQRKIVQVATPDGPYLMLLWPTGEYVLTSEEANMALKVLLQRDASVRDSGANALAQDLSASQLVVLIAQRLGETEQTVQTFTSISLGGALIVIVLAVVSSLLIVGRALRPLTAITYGAERLAQGDYGYRVALDGSSDEVGRLGTAFDGMATAIATAFSTQRRFVADASHELRTPLTALRGYTDVLLMGGDGNAATSERVLHAMQEDLARMSRLVNDLLTLARLDGGAALQTGPIAVADLLASAAGEAEAIARGAQHIAPAPVARELIVCGDYDRLRQVLSNVVGNACAYSPPGSTISLRAEHSDGRTTITVQDDGPGIPPADLARLGERFYRGDTARGRRTGGTGLGLAIARAIVEAHGGTLGIDSTLGVGTTVTIGLPTTSRAMASVPSPPTAVAPFA